MKIMLATPSLLKEVGGPAYSVSAIDEFLRKAGVETRLVARRGRGGLAVPALGRDRIFDGVDLVHNFGTWTPFNHLVSTRARDNGVPQVFCPMGMLEPWALSQKRLKKRLGLEIYQRHDIACSAAVHATARSEAQNLRALGVKVPLAVIPHGIDVSFGVPKRPSARQGADRKTALFLSRIHPKKGLLELVEAWARLRPHDWRVVIAGPDQDGYQSVVEDAVHARGLQDVLAFAGPVYGEQKSELLALADLFVLPTYSENFGIVIVEALAHGVPVITTTGAPWAELPEAGCGWWVPTGVSSLAEALSEAFALPGSALTDMGIRGRALVEARYTWQAIIRKHIELYTWVLGGGQRPDFIMD